MKDTVKNCPEIEIFGESEVTVAKGRWSFIKKEGHKKIFYSINCPQEGAGCHQYLSFLLPLGVMRKLKRVRVPMLGFEAET